MRRLAPLLGVATGLAVQTGCAAQVWDARTFNNCDKVDEMVVVGGTLHVRDDEGDGCWIEVYGIDQLETPDDGRVLVGDAEVWVHGTVPWSTRDARLDVATRRLEVDAGRGDHEWSPGARRLSLDTDRDAWVEGDVEELVLEGDGEVVVAESDTLVRIEGEVGRADIQTLAEPTSIDLDADDDIVLYLPTEPTYQLDLEGNWVFVDPQIRRAVGGDGVPLTASARQIYVLPNDLATYYYRAASPNGGLR